MRRGSAWEALERLHEARAQVWQLWAAVRGVPQPQYGLTSVLDYSPSLLPSGAEATVSDLDLGRLLAAGLGVAELLGEVGNQLGTRLIGDEHHRATRAGRVIPGFQKTRIMARSWLPGRRWPGLVADVGLEPGRASEVSLDHVIMTGDPGRMTTMTAPAWFCRPAARHWRASAPDTAAPSFHAELPGYRPTELTELPALADELGVGRVFVKDESSRMGLGAFKVLGASWAIARLLCEEGGDSPDGGGPPGEGGSRGRRITLDEVRRAAAAHPVELVTATDGNHGRAVAWTARLLGLEARVFVPRVVPERARAAIEAEGATVTVAGESYDEAVRQAAAYADTDGRRLVQDTAWAGYQSVPGWIVDGYGTLLAELDRQFGERDLAGPDLVSVPVGVGSLAQAVVTHYRRDLGGAGDDRAPAILAVEPETAAAVLASLHAGSRQSVPTTGTVMAGLDCGTPSSLAWPVLAGGLDAAIAVTDQLAIRAGADLAGLGVRSGPSGAASLAGVRAALTGPGAEARRAGLGVTGASVVLLLSTEGS